MAKIIGIDFGTTNSLISVVLSGKVKSFLNDQRLPHPSVVCYDSKGIIVGREAKERLSDNVEGVLDNIVRSPKIMLGKGNLFISGREIQPSKVITDLMTFLKHDAEQNDDDSGADLSQAVVSIPVAMDGRARVELRDALLQAGIHTVQFVHEPLAAFYGYLKDQPDLDDKLRFYHDKLTLVFDWGGGTLDLTLCQLTDGAVTQVVNVGDNTVGGDFIDKAIKSYVLEQHTTNNNINSALPVNPGAKARLLHACEKAKIDLSDKEKILIYVPDYYAVDEEYRDIELFLTRENLDSVSQKYINRGLNAISDLLEKLNIDQRQIALCLATGGMVNMPAIKQRLLQLFSIDRLEVSSKGDRIISEGCAWIAHDDLRVSLAKPIEIVEARQSYYSVFKSGTPLPYEGEIITESLDMYCVDPRDGKAKFQIVRPEQIKKSAASDPRMTYDNLVVKVDDKAKAFFERINLDFTIDDNFIIGVTASSSLTNDTDHCEIYDLEFSLSLPDTSSVKIKQCVNSTEEEINTNSIRENGAVCARSNVTQKKGKDALVPGEFLRTYNVRAFDPEQGSATPIQSEEKLFYQPCSICQRYYNHPECHCDETLITI